VHEQERSLGQKKKELQKGTHILVDTTFQPLQEVAVVVFFCCSSSSTLSLTTGFYKAENWLGIVSDVVSEASSPLLLMLFSVCCYLSPQPQTSNTCQ
jgi:hypothetical protein